MLKIKNKFGSDLDSFDSQQIKAPQVKKLLKEIDVKKAAGVDTIPPKLIKIGADIIAEPLTQAINYCLRQGIFPDNPKVASVVPLDKGKPDKYDVLNYRPVSILNAFSKIYEKVIKKTSFSFYISVQKKLQHSTGSYSSVRGMEREIRQEFYCGCSFNGPLRPFFDCIPRDLIIAKLAACGIE